MRVTVDPWKYQSNLLCVFVAPEIFVYDDELSHTKATSGEWLG